MVLTEKQKNNFWDKVEKTDTCWHWTGHTLNGYGKVNINKSVYNAHRISLIIKGILKEPSKKELGAKGEVIMHICDNRDCVNPQHLKVTDQKENMRDAIRKGRHFVPDWSGVNNPKAKLTGEDISLIRGSQLKASKLAELYKVDSTSIYGIINNKSWTHVKQ